MATDLSTRPSGSEEDQDDRIQRHYDDTFNDLTSDEHQAKSGIPGDVGNGEGRSLYNPGGDGGSSSAGAAGSTQSSGSTTGDGLYNPSGDGKKGGDGAPKSRLGRLGNALGVRQRAMNKFSSWSKGKKWLVGGFAVGGGGFGAIILLLILLVGALKIPHLGENITAYQFARVFQQSAVENERVTATKIAIDSAKDNVYTKLKGKYDAASTKVSEKWAKLDKYRPNQVIANMDESEAFRLNYEGTTKLGRPILTSLSIKDGKIPLTNTTGLKNLIPGYKLNANIKLASEVQPALKQALRANEIGPITRGIVAKKIRQQLGISLVAWTVGKYKGKSAKEARIMVEQDAEEKINSPDKSGSAKTSEIQKAVDAAEETQDADAKDPEKVQQIIDDGGVDKNVEKSINDALSTGWLEKGVGFVNSAYAIATPICIVYDGSIDNSGSTVDSQSTAQQKTFYYIESAADQEKDGNDGDPVVIGAINDKLGDINGANAMVRASGDDYETTNTPSPQAGGGGEFTAFDAIFGKNAGSAILNKIVGTACPALTSLKGAIGIAGLNIALGIVSLGTSEGVEEAAGQSAIAVIKHIVTKAIEKLSLKNIVGAGRKLKSFMGDAVKSGAKIAAATIFAKMVVASRAGYFNNGFEQGEDLANLADSGGNLHANEIMRQQFYGRPLTKDETSTATAQTLAYVRQENASKSAYQRYVALNNPSSLLTNMGVGMSRSLSSSMTTVSSIANSLLSPFHTVASTVSGTNRSLAFAASKTMDPSLLNYGNIQWGWTKQEEALRKQPTYQLLENQRVLDNSGKETEIQDKYGKCFDGQTTIGTLLQDKDIQRDEDGHVYGNSDNGDCAPANLGTHNPTYGDLVFRYRIAHSDDQALDTALDQQTITQGVAGGSKFRIASYNIKTGSSEAWNVASTNNMSSNHFDIVGMQELEQEGTYTSITSKLYKLGYETYPAPDSVGKIYRNGLNARTIAWNSSRFQLVKTDEVDFPRNNDPEQPAKAPIVWLQDKETDQQFIVINTHNPSDVSTNHTEAMNQRYQAAQNYTAKIKELQSENLPIFFTGDFNEGYGPGGGQGTTNYQHLSYCMLESQNLMKAPEIDNPDDYCKPGGKTGAIDHILVSPQVQATFGQLTGSSAELGTDHARVPYADIVIPGGSSGAGGSLLVATYNVRGSGHDGEAGTPPYPGRMDKTVDVIKSNNFDVIGFQEFTGKQYDLFKSKAGDTYALTKKGDHHLTENAIAWNKSKYTLVKEDKMPDLQYFFGSTLWDPYVRLKDNGTGQEFYVLNTHDPANAQAGNQGRCECAAERLHDANAHVSFINSLKPDGLPIIFTGDFNSGYNIGGNNAPVGNKPENLTYCILTKNNNVYDAYDLAKKRPAKCPNPLESGDAAGASNGIDHIYLSEGITVSNFKRIPSNNYENGSDHPTVFANINFPGGGGGSGGGSSGGGGGGSSTGPSTPSSDFVGQDGFGSGTCVDYVKYILNRHSSKYHGQVDLTSGYQGISAYTVADNLGSKLGYTVNHTPAVHATVSFSTKYGNAYYGHVAIVGQINKDGSIVVEESNWTVHDHYGTHTVPASEVPHLTYAHTEAGWH